MVDLESRELLARIALMYYEQDMTQNEIADQLGLSRAKVQRLLRDSREKGVVHISIDWPIERDPALERALRAAYGLVDARVLKSGHDQPMPPLRMLGSLCARFMEELLGDVSRLAICWGRSTYEVVSALRPDLRANIQIVQAMGSIPSSRAGFDSSMLARQLAQKLGGQVVYLPSPLMADSAGAAQVLRSQRSIQHTLSMASSAEIALLGVGDLDAQTSGFVREGFMSEGELRAMVEDGAVGDIAWRIYRGDGSPYPCSFNDRVIGITLDDLRQVPATLAVACGPTKVRAIAGGLRTGAIKLLCTDDRTASAVLALA